MLTKPLPDKNIAIPKNAILNLLLVPETAAAASINKLNVTWKEGLPVQLVSADNFDDDNGSQINRNPPI